MPGNSAVSLNIWGFHALMHYFASSKPRSFQTSTISPGSTAQLVAITLSSMGSSVCSPEHETSHPLSSSTAPSLTRWAGREPLPANRPCPVPTSRAGPLPGPALPQGLSAAPHAYFRHTFIPWANVGKTCAATARCLFPSLLHGFWSLSLLRGNTLQ